MKKAASDDLLRRAFAAYFRAGEMDQPANSSDIATYRGKRYVVLKNVRGIMAVYRVRNDGILKRLRRWPASLEGRLPLATSSKGGRKHGTRQKSR